MVLVSLHILDWTEKASSVKSEKFSTTENKSSSFEFKLLNANFTEYLQGMQVCLHQKVQYSIWYTAYHVNTRYGP